MLKRLRATPAAVGGALVWLLLGCASPQPGGASDAGGIRQLAETARLPGVHSATQVLRSMERGGYLDVDLERGGEPARLFFPDTEACRALLQPGRSVAFVEEGPFGALDERVESGDFERCSAVGVASLRAWVDQRRRPSARGIPRSQANFEIIFKDEELVFVRGRFPLVRLAGISGGEDIVALVPNTEECIKPLASGVASMEFNARGKKPPFRLLGSRSDCPIKGFAQPQGRRQGP